MLLYTECKSWTGQTFPRLLGKQIMVYSFNPQVRTPLIVFTSLFFLKVSFNDAPEKQVEL